MSGEFNHKIFSLSSENFEREALAVFHYQWQNNLLYRRYVELIGKTPGQIQRLQEIPFLPISFYKSHPVKCGDFIEEAVFESSGTTGAAVSRHFIKDLALYRESFLRAFDHFYGPASSYCILGLLPSYLERGHSSLVYMVDHLIQQSAHPRSGFYLYDHSKLAATITELEILGQPTILIGVTFALLDFAAHFPMALAHTTIIETGGMKGRRKEMTRHEVHEFLSSAFRCGPIHSEYGMTELLSQAYASRDGLFRCPPWMHILIRDEDDPFTVYNGVHCRGSINIVDLANIHSCSFIATDDIGRLYSDGSFEVLGRMDGSELRGCSLMVV